MQGQLGARVAAASKTQVFIGLAFASTKKKKMEDADAAAALHNLFSRLALFTPPFIN